MREYRFVIALFLGVSAAPEASLAKNCDAILANGLSNTFNFSDNSSFDRAIHSAICTNRSSRSNSSSSVGLNIPLPDIGSMLGFDSSNSAERSRIDQYCRSFSDVENRQAAINWTKSVVDKTVVDAWSACDAEKGFLCSTETLSDQDFQLTLSWTRTNLGVGTEKAVLSAPPSQSNANCPLGALGTGLEIPDDGAVSVLCRFTQPGQAAYVIFNSSQGPSTCAAIPPAKVVPPADHVSDCLGGNEIGCLAIFQDAGVAERACAGIRAAADPNAQNSLSPQEKSQLNFFAYARCGNLAAAVTSVRDVTDIMQQACYGPVVTTANCNAAKAQLQSSAALYEKEVGVLLAFDPDDPAAILSAAPSSPFQ